MFKRIVASLAIVVALGFVIPALAAEHVSVGSGPLGAYCSVELIARALFACGAIVGGVFFFSQEDDCRLASLCFQAQDLMP